jgi:hypothetical protein
MSATQYILATSSALLAMFGSAYPPFERLYRGIGDMLIITVKFMKRSTLANSLGKDSR